MEQRFMCRLLAFVLPLLILCACSGAPTTTVLPPKPPELPAFPPQKVMESGDFAGFLADNQKALSECNSESSLADGRCDVVLFNLGFAHAYSKSPYYNQAKALRYFEELTRKYPQSPWAFQARAWIDIMKKVSTSEGKRRRLQGELKSKDAAINGLQEQIKRSRDIDMEMERKERELLK